MNVVTKMWDSDTWRKERNEKLLKWMKGNEAAVAVCLRISQIAEVWDDLIDRDKPIGENEIHAVFESALFELAYNPFYMGNLAAFTTLNVISVNAWRDSLTLEKATEKRDRQLAFHLRNYVHEVFSLAAFLVGGFNHLRDISLEMRMFFQHESFDTWELKEVP